MFGINFEIEDTALHTKLFLIKRRKNKQHKYVVTGEISKRDATTMTVIII